MIRFKNANRFAGKLVNFLVEAFGFKQVR